MIHTAKFRYDQVMHRSLLCLFVPKAIQLNQNPPTAFWAVLFTDTYTSKTNRLLCSHTHTHILVNGQCVLPNFTDRSWCPRPFGSTEYL